ncbi:MAG: hypothetical protein A2204_01660 [Elusimicrobia bacterium RIFOXYA1_FULL_47_7]|nr:MAG: hypothetical protein A2204_01660 [Elusimicrobia bacterium RIFOXYA1_FULL_47_7]OGS10410.1 MAG: hypothetical protein A2386_07155 [Elusimicrobia bacterium RIFOXYB1_FULL_48_9]OGS16715.1 MAG: hypothetical protein A2251_00850 [Elusimicrobia bacterium RIFOXYA2_FULL_47_53]OGS26768.1 MAG: hypothetical protein A2339_04105 [Elusimicrobia bacterium RIFOXYB12_FULL_50_12]OGS31674.1 MAG: hypothetical protein A2323_05680 [Elusimicrobia bacterium RIFOXYB2_FULL_46_23]
MAKEKQINDDYKDFINLLNKFGVKYLIVGAYSVIFHTNIPRETRDIDFWIEKNSKNAEKCAKAIHEFCGILIDKNDLLGEKEIFFIGEEPNRIDIFNTQKHISFESAFKNRKVGDFQGIKAYFISAPDLVKLMENFRRDIDLKDVKRIKTSLKNHHE